MTSSGSELDTSKEEPKTTDHDTTPAHSYPEGGLRAWGVVLAAFGIMLSVYGPINSAAVFELHLREHQLSGYSHERIGWIFSLYLFTLYFAGLLIGPVFDRHGHRLLVLSGSLCIVAGAMLFSLSSRKKGSNFTSTSYFISSRLMSTIGYYQFVLSFSILGGLGGALLNSPSYAVIGHYFFKRRGFATGVAATAGGIGGIIFPLILRSTLPSPEGLGFGWSVRILGFILLAILATSNLILFCLTRSNTNSHHPPPKRSDSARPDLRVFRDPRFSLCCAGIFLMEYGVLIPLTYIMSYATAHGMSAASSYKLPALLNAGSVAGRVIPGIAADRLGRFNTLIATVGGCALSVLALWLPARDSQPLLVAFTVLLGFASGGNVSLIPVCIGQICETRHYGRYLSTAMLLAGFGTLTGIPIGGALLGLRESVRWDALILFSGLSYLASFLCYAAARVLAVGWDPRVVY
ncbi:hypothetical protein K4F52_001323 [Lecanicillium sp. MT-2017a]|nr:hypothetical protein K4F52_001323 [Lecanicillium sp. MT-2017a]